MRYWPADSCCAAGTVIHVSSGVIYAAGAHGCDPNDLIPNCDFNSFSGNMPSGFSPVIMSGQVNFAPARGSESHSASGDSLRLDSNGTYVAAIYTRVDGLQPGTAYKASWVLLPAA